MTLKQQQISKRKRNLSIKIKKGGWGSVEELPKSNYQGGSRKRRVQKGGKWSNSKISFFGLL